METSLKMNDFKIKFIYFFKLNNFFFYYTDKTNSDGYQNPLIDPVRLDILQTKVF